MVSKQRCLQAAFFCICRYIKLLWVIIQVTFVLFYVSDVSNFLQEFDSVLPKFRDISAIPTQGTGKLGSLFLAPS